MLSSSAMLFAGFLSVLTAMASIGEKRTILTSGEKVQTIHYQQGQSTVLYFGMKPETVICGNKNYFHIDKIKEGITIQGVSNFSTNLTVLSQGRHFLFYLTPASGARPDTFVDVRWVPESEAKPVLIAKTKQVVRPLKGRLNLGTLEFQLVQEITVESAKRSILEFEIKNAGRDALKTSGVEIRALKGVRPLAHQVSVFELDELKPGASTKGRLIVTGESLKTASLIIKSRGKAGKLQGVAY